MTNEQTRAYVAGFIDGEGYIGMLRRYNKNGSDAFFVVPCVKVANTNYIVLDMLFKRYGGHLDKERFQKMPNRKPAKMWSIRNRKLVIAFLEDIVDYLMLKDKQAKIVIEFIKKCGTWRQYAMPEIERREYYDAMRKLNHRGLATTN